MKFYTVTDTEGASTNSCFMSLAEAVEFGNDPHMLAGEFDVRVDEVRVSADVIRRLLGNVGGYCQHCTRMRYRDGRLVSTEKAF